MMADMAAMVSEEEEDTEEAIMAVMAVVMLKEVTEMTVDMEAVMAADTEEDTAVVSAVENMAAMAVVVMVDGEDLTSRNQRRKKSVIFKCITGDLIG